MTTTGTYTFNPALGELVIGAYARCGIRRTELSQQHMEDARFEANMLMSNWAGNGINLWEVDTGTIDLLANQATYTIPTNTVFLLDVYITQGTNPAINRLIMPISRTDYASIANKQQTGFPTSYWFDRLINPNLYIWPVPPQSGIYTLTYYRMRQAQDSDLSNGATVEVPWYQLDAFLSGLAARLAMIYAPDKAQMLDANYQASWQKVLQAGTENVPVKIMPQLRSYFR